MQEELLEASSKRYQTRSFTDVGKSSVKPTFLAPPSILGTPTSPDNGRPTTGDSTIRPTSVAKPKWDSKLTYLQA